jgi:hypothetical protein
MQHVLGEEFCQKSLKETAIGRSRCMWEDNIKADLREIG